MSVKTTDLVKKLLAKAGVQHDEEIGDELPDEVATAVDNALLTVAIATNNHPQIKKVYFAQAYNGLDAELEGVVSDLGLDETQKAALKAETSSTKRVAAAFKLLKEKKAAEAGEPEKQLAPLKTQIQQLHDELRIEKENSVKAKTAFEDQLKAINIKSKLETMLSGYKTVYDELPVEAKQAAVDALITKALQDNDAKFVFDDKGAVTIQKTDGTNLFGDNHTQVTPQSFLDKTLSKILKVTDPPPNPGAGGGSNRLPANGTSQQQNGNASLSAAIKESADNYASAIKSPASGN